jgi:hypothetical protein
MVENDKSIPDVLTLASKEKFRRKLLFITRIIALLLVGAIVWIGFIQIAYVREVSQIREKYNSLGYCYLCGYETLRKCECQYRPDIERTMGVYNQTELQEQTALNNVAPCSPYMGGNALSLNESLVEGLKGINNSG